MRLFKKKPPYRPTGRFALGKVNATGTGWLNGGDEIEFSMLLEETAQLGPMSKVKILHLTGDKTYFRQIREEYDNAFVPTSKFIWHDPNEWKDEFLV